MTAVLARRPGPLVTFRRLVTVLRLPLQGSKAVAASRHEPLPDLLYPGMCNVCFYPLGARRHRRGRSRRPARPAPDLTAGGWR